ncbi:MAG: alkaline phosphatase family protein [Ignavibacteria bacterium]
MKKTIYILLLSILVLFTSYSNNSNEKLDLTILIGIDGFRWDIIDRNDLNTPNLNLIAKNGTRSKLISS